MNKPRAHEGWVLLVGLLMTPGVRGQVVNPTQKPADRKDSAVEAASEMIGRATFLRCFCSENSLAFDAQGRAVGAVKTTDWTLAGVNVLKVERKGPGEVELDGVRVAVRYAPDRREWDRHVLNEEKVKITVADAGNAGEFAQAIETVFAQGIDLRLQHAMPAFWQHFFSPAMAWPNDGSAGQQVYAPGPGGALPQGMTAAALQHKAEPGYTPAAIHDRVAGFVLLRMVVDATGEPRRIAVVQPLGYGLDEKAAEAAAKLRFVPGMVAGKSVASAVVVKQEFVLMATPR